MTLKKAIYKNVFPPLASLITNGLMSTTRRRIINPSVHDYHSTHPDVTAIFCFWHGKLVLPYFAYRNLGISILISEHRDGEIIARMVEYNGYRPVRGSSTRGGARGVKELLKVARRGGIIAVTPDGPRGPKRRLKEGVVFLAQMTGAPLYSMGVGYSKYRQLRDWSGMQIPKLFAHAVTVFGKEIRVPRRINREESEGYRLAIENDLNRCNALAERIARGG